MTASLLRLSFRSLSAALLAAAVSCTSPPRDQHAPAVDQGTTECDDGAAAGLRPPARTAPASGASVVESAQHRAASPADSSIRITINVPAYRLDLIEADSIVRSLQIAVGSPRYPTPIGDYQVTTVTWNPWWVPPPGDWARNKKKTPPGPSNPMGKVKLNYSTYYYLHGTPDSASIGSAASHGCVRLPNAEAVQLAVLLREYQLLDLAEQEQRQLLSDWTSTRTLAVGPPLPLEVRYDLVEVRDSTVWLYDDVYHRHSGDLTTTIIDALISAGSPRADIDSAAVASFARAARSGGQTSVQSLLHGHD